MAQEQKPRTLRVIWRMLILLTIMAGVFFASFFVTLYVKTGEPISVIKLMFVSDEERQRKIFADFEEARRRRRNLSELENKKDASASIDESVDKSVDKSVDDKNSIDDKSKTDVSKTERDVDRNKKFEGASFSAKWARLRSIRAAVEERVKGYEHYVPLDEIPRALRQAIVAIEDSRFYTHKGFDPEGIARATVVNVEAGQIEEGASTITQQLVKNLFLSQEQSFTRKIEEILLAINLEQNFTKDEILELYLNTIYFGSNFYGVYEAAEGYFGKEPSDLTLAECAMLAGLPQAPSLYSPYVDFMLAKRRQLMVISAMVRANILTEKEAERARVDTITLVDHFDGG